MAVMEGTLSKWTNVMKGWQFRWFVLDDNAGLLSYYTSKEKMMKGVRRGCVRLRGAVIGIDDEDDSTFTITVDGKTFHFQARSSEERENWIRALEDTILRHAKRTRWDPSRPAPTIQDFDKKLVEADAYLQIIIDQIKDLEVRMEKMSDEDKARCVTIHNHATNMLDSIKHSIVMLQIAKNMANPVNGIYRPPDTLPMSAVASSAATPSPQQGLDASSLKSGILRDEGEDEDDGLRMGIEVGAECVESRRQRTMPASSSRSSLSNVSAVSSAGHRPSMTLIVPATSYSSSEEEDFFDANEYNETPSSSATPTIGGLHPFVEQQSLEECPGNSSQQDDANERPSSVPPKVHDDGTLDYDALYEDESDPENGIENQGTVISHLISQVKIGMDLTKVVLPTFILERRSLLEMYADYFAHPDLFVKIADFKDPKDRMVQVLRWYVSAYHAGRKSAVAKKPYNPIIGEIFQCYWDIPDTTDDDQSPVTDGPIPWCSKNQLTFIAEQVSHHPPISAFYAEHFNRRISFCAHVWTKSKFLGLSVGVHNIGQGCISVLDYDEEYIVTFPNGYGRSILTTPWIELGGSVVISCAKTGYNATVEFLTKPFYGGKKNRILAEIYKPNEKKSFLTIAGEWNGLMEAKWADGRQEVFVDVNKINVVKKKVRPIAQQEDYESRKLWKEVTAGLRLKDIDRATNAKFELEQKQREEAKIRKEEGLAWETKVFHLAGENWVYKEPLVKRLPPKQNLL